MSRDLIRILARWALLHEIADEAWRAAVARGRGAAGHGRETSGEAHDSTEAFLCALAAVIADEKDKLRQGIAHGAGEEDILLDESPVLKALEEMRFELAEIRARLECLSTAVDVLMERLNPEEDSA